MHAQGEGGGWRACSRCRADSDTVPEASCAGGATEWSLLATTLLVSNLQSDSDVSRAATRIALMFCTHASATTATANNASEPHLQLQAVTSFPNIRIVSHCNAPQRLS